MSKLSHKQNIFKVFVLFSFCIFPSYTSISYMNQYSHIQNKEIDSTLPDEQKLIYELLSTYDTAARPVFNASKNVIIDISLSLIQISDMVGEPLLSYNQFIHFFKILFLFNEG